MGKLIKWGIAICILIVAFLFFAPKKTPPLVWKTQTTEQGVTSTSFATIKGDKVLITDNEPNTIVLSSAQGDLAFAKVKVECYNADENKVFEDTYTFKELGNSHKGEFTSRKVSEFLRSEKGVVRLCTELKDGENLGLNIPTWASRKPIRAPSEQKVKETKDNIKNKTKAIFENIGKEE